MASKSTFSEINQKYWDNKADTVFKEEWIQNIMRQIFDNLQAHIDWIGIRKGTATDPPVRMLDYACGSGVASRALFPYVSEIRGIDVSDGMVEQYNKSARNQRVPESQMHAIRGDLTVPSPIEASFSSLLISNSEFSGFDLIVVSMALHHIEDPELLSRRLVERLGEKGSVLIIDWTPMDQLQHQQAQMKGNESHEASHTVMHEGFNKEQMDSILRQAGCDEVDYLVLNEPSKVPASIGGQKQLFFARGRKEASK